MAAAGKRYLQPAGYQGARPARQTAGVTHPPQPTAAWVSCPQRLWGAAEGPCAWGWLSPAPCHGRRQPFLGRCDSGNSCMGYFCRRPLVVGGRRTRYQVPTQPGHPEACRPHCIQSPALGETAPPGRGASAGTPTGSRRFRGGERPGAIPRAGPPGYLVRTQVPQLPATGRDCIGAS